MRKSAMAFVLVTVFSLLFFCSVPLMAATETEEEKPTVAKATDELMKSIEDQPVSIVEWADAGASFLLRITEKLWKTGKPMVGLKKGNHRFGLEFNVFEEERFSLTAGKFFVENEEGEDNGGIPEFEKHWFFGIELKGIPFASHISEVFEKLRPQLLLYDGKTWIALSYKFRNEVE